SNIAYVLFGDYNTRRTEEGICPGFVRIGTVNVSGIESGQSRARTGIYIAKMRAGSKLKLMNERSGGLPPITSLLSPWDRVTLMSLLVLQVSMGNSDYLLFGS
ncbi:hypothetical protein EVAR_50077_1, partial [Eumeta japonica]